MADFNFRDSVYKFTDPPRYFKANDPFYFEVMNKPLKQLQENVNWLRDQLSDLGGSVNIDRGDIKELRPSTTGSDNTVRIQPGRFTGRINDARRSQHQFLQMITGAEFGESDTYRIPNAKSGTYEVNGQNLNNAVLAVLDEFKNGVASGANGLEERAFTYPVQNYDKSSQFVSNTEPKVVANGSFTRVPPFPISQFIRWANSSNSDFMDIQNYNILSPSIGAAEAARLEVETIRRWRAPFRTAVVDVPEELSLTVPRFDPEDFFYIDSNGNKVIIEGATVRIDLVFIYSKPVDQASTTIGRYVGNSPTTITTPAIGLVKGAGLGVSYKVPDSGANQPESLITVNEESKMLPNVGDESETNNGFAALNVHGSFPSPDDILNQSPVLINEFSGSDFELVGQSILPIAYVVVRKDSSVLSPDDIIDIRPFLRTTELTYGERAGIAAAAPQLSIANPVVTKANLDNESNRAKRYTDSKIDILINNPPRPRSVAQGFVQGGYFYGVEGVLAQYEYVNGQITPGDRTAAWNNVVNRFSLPSTTPFSPYPQWDQPFWATQTAPAGADLSDWGTRANDWLTPVYLKAGITGTAFGSYENKDQTNENISDYPDIFSLDSNSRLKYPGTPVGSGDGNNVGLSYVFCHKTIFLDKSNVPWMFDYDVEVNYWNCAPMTSRGAQFGDGAQQGSIAGIWVDKRRDKFTIYVAWTASDAFKGQVHTESDDYVLNPQLQRDGRFFAGHIVMNEDLRTLTVDSRNDVYNGESKIGLCIYPSITYRVIGYPGGFQGNYYDGRNAITLY